MPTAYEALRRIAPIVDASQVIDGTLRHFDNSIEAQVVDVRYHFQKGSGRMLRLVSPRLATPPAR